jgi:hypothetical protein
MSLEGDAVAALPESLDVRRGEFGELRAAAAVASIRIGCLC